VRLSRQVRYRTCAFMTFATVRLRCYWLKCFRFYGAPGMTRTCDLLVRSQRTYPNSLIIEQILLQENSI